MVTNPIHTILTKYGNLVVNIENKEVNLNMIVIIANSLRYRRKLPRVQIRDFVRSRQFVQTVLSAERQLGLRTFTDTSGVEIEYKTNGEIMRYHLAGSPLVRAVRGGHGGGGTWINPLVGVGAASALNKDLAAEIYNRLLNYPGFRMVEEYKNQEEFYL